MRKRGNPGGGGDWTCGGCTNVNFARRTQCNRCGEKRETIEQPQKYGVIGKDGAAKSGGLFKENDWKCYCGNINWANRERCNECQAPRPGTKEDRSGRGGGFNEREPLAYKKRDNDDDGEMYDDMGRLKKKYRK